MPEVLGFIGLGRMGAPIAGRLLERGHEMVVHDVDAAAAGRLAAAGARVAADPAAVGDAADIVMICLPTPAIVEQVATGPRGIIEGHRARYLVDLSTTGPRVSRMVSQALSARGISLVDCPVTGGVAGAKSGALTMILGASDDALAATRPILECIGRDLVVAGPHPGDGQMLKVINNLLSFIALEATAEAMALGVRYGLDAEAMLRVFNGGTGRNSATEEKFPRAVMTRSFDFGFSVRSVNKDIGLCLAEADELGVPMPVGTSARQIWTLAMAELGDQDMTSIVKLFERWAGVEVSAGHPVGQ